MGVRSPRGRGSGLPLSLFPTLFIALAGYGWSGQAPVASVDGVNIYYEEIEITPEAVQSFVQEQEAQRLAGRIKELIATKAAERMGILVTDQEVAREVDREFAKAGIGERQAKQVAEVYRALADALEAWYKDKSKGDAIYDRMLAGVMTKAQWHAWQKCYPDAGKLSALRRLMPKGLGDMKENSRRSTRQDLLHKSLVERITGGVAVTDAEVGALYEDTYADKQDKPPLDKVAGQLRRRLLERKKRGRLQTWWRQEYRRARIEVKDDRFAKAISILEAQLGVERTLSGHMPAATPPVATPPVVK